jgi:predicted transcriptional regulator
MTKQPFLPVLGELEQLVLQFLWEQEDADVLETHAQVGKERGISPNTVGSALERLYKKELLDREKVSHAYRYRAKIDRQAYRARSLLEAAGGLKALGDEGVLAAFVHLVADADREALNELGRLVSEQKSKRGGTK